MLLAGFLMAGSGLAQLDRGAITGTVTDSSGAVIPEVKITIRNADTGATYVTATTSTGEYMMPNLPNGLYDLTFAVKGFKTSVRRGVPLSVATTQRADVTLEVGQLTDSVEVTATMSGIETESPEVATTIVNRSMLDLPLSVSSGGRLMESVMYQALPGAQGSGYTSHINGSQTFGVESLLDGATTTNEYLGYFAEMSVSVEAVQEFKVQTSATSAEFGRTQGSVLNYVMKSGTNRVHGSAFGLIRNEVLDANTFVNNFNGLKRPVDRQWDFAFSGGGPVYIPKVYDGRNKTFFYGCFEPYHEEDIGVGPNTQSYPIAAFYQGDFSRLLGAATGTTDALGNAIPKGAIYDPTTFYQLPTGQWEGTMFPGNQIPVSRFSRVAQNLNAIASKSYLPTAVGSNGLVPLQNNAPLMSPAIWLLIQRQYSMKVDENISDRSKLSGSLTVTYRPRSEYSYDSSAMYSTLLPNGGPLSEAINQDEKTWMGRLAHDWIFSPSKLNHFMIYFNRYHNWFDNANEDTDGAKALGIQGYDTQGYPTFAWGSGPSVTLSQPGRASINNYGTDTYGIIDTFNFSHGSHFMKAGFEGDELRFNNRGSYNPIFNFSPLSTSLPNYAFSGNQSGYSFASYLLGIVYSATLDVALPVTDIGRTVALFFQDDWKATSRLSLSLGLRWDWMSAIDEANNRLDGWTPAVTDPLSGLPGAYVFASGNCSTYCNEGQYSGVGKGSGRFAPRIGFAYRFSATTSIRGAYSIFNQGYAQTKQPLTTNVRNGYMGTWQENAKAINGWQGIVNIDSNLSSLYSPPALNPSWGDSNVPAYFSPSYPIMPYIQHWNFNVQHSLPDNWILDVGYLGLKGTKLRDDTMGWLDQLQPSLMQTFGTNLLNPVTNASQAAANGIAYPYPGFSGTVASALRQYPQVAGNSTIMDVGAPVGFSTTNQLQATIEKRFSQGLTAYLNYVWSKTLTDADAGLNGGLGPQNAYDLAAEKSIADYDIASAFRGTISYELPVGQGRALGGHLNKFVNGVIGGWGLSTILTMQDGTPLTFTTSSSPLAGGWNGCVVPSTSTLVGTGSGTPALTTGSGCVRINVASAPNMLAGGFSKGNFNLASTSSAADTYLNKSDYSDVRPLTLGTAAYTYGNARAFGTRNVNLSFMKGFRIRENVHMSFRLEVLNAFNRQTLGGIITNVTSSLFGQVTSISGQRTAQIAGRLDF